MNPIYTFAEEYEKELAVANREFDIAMVESRMMTESVVNQFRVNMALSELKVMEENGTASDLAELIMEAGEEAAEESRGILAKVFDAIAKFFKGIANGIQKFFSGNKAGIDQLKAQNKPVPVDKKTHSLIQTLQEAEGKLNEAANAKDHKAFKVAIGAAVTGAAGAALFAIFKSNGKFRKDGEAEETVEISAADAENKLNWIKGFGDKINGLFEKAKSFFVKDKGQANAQVSDRLQQKLADKKTADVEAAAKAEEDKQFRHNLFDKGLSTDQINEIEKNRNMTPEQKNAARIERNKAKAAARAAVTNKFIGMFEAGTEDDESTGALNFLKSVISTATAFIENGIKTALSKIGAVASGAVSGAIAGANAAANPPKKGLFGNKFVGDGDGDLAEESAGSEVDPIEAMLSGLAFGGYHG